MTLGEEHVVLQITVVRLLCRDIDDENRAVSGMSDSGLLGAHGYVVVFSGLLVVVRAGIGVVLLLAGCDKLDVRACTERIHETVASGDFLACLKVYIFPVAKVA